MVVLRQGEGVVQVPGGLLVSPQPGVGGAEASVGMGAEGAAG